MITAKDIQFTHDLDPMAVAAFFVRADQLRDEPDVTPMKLQKLLYLAQANFLASTGHRLFDASVEAFDHGPIVHEVWREFSGRQIISPETHPEAMSLRVPNDTEDFLDHLWVIYQDWTPNALRRLTHEQSPWKDHYTPGSYRTVIPDESMQSYFATQVPISERVFHRGVVVVPPEIFEDDDEADRKLAAFLGG